ncbi:MAG: (Fe-S)-binding protein [Proteobacteria bacterium]|nr:(Fe-S)-binding protein [Pseudomonadota bacterium]
MNPVAMTLMLVLLWAAFSWSAARRWRLLAAGRQEPTFGLAHGAWLRRLTDTLVYALGQRRMPYYRAAGVAHIMIFAGFCILLVRTLVLWGRGYDEAFTVWGLLALEHPLGSTYNVIKDLFAVLVIAGSLVFVYLRLVTRPKRLALGLEGLIILGIIISMMLADLLYDAANLVLLAKAAGGQASWNPIEPAGSLLALGLASLEPDADMLQVLRGFGFWWHSAFVLIFLNLLPYSKHFHVITAIPNVFTRSLEPPGKLPKTEDLEGRVEREESLGIVTIRDLSWKDILDLYTCTECGRCSDNCPAYLSGKSLSPKHVTLALRDHLYACEAELVPGTESRVERSEAAPELGRGAPEASYFVPSSPVALLPHVLRPEVVWACTTCRACEQECPVMISYVDKFVRLRRDRVMIDNEFPTELTKPFNGIETNGNPWNLSSMDRAAWCEGLDVPLVSDKRDAPVLYWVGCAASYDDRAKRIARATAKLLKAAGVDFAILGTEERCTGDPARRAGNEYLFQMLAAANVETLNNYGAMRKTIITTCPHCFNALLNEYSDFGGQYEVVHHTDYLLGLLAQRKLVPAQTVTAEVAYHDSCYLGRYNDIYESPRAILESIPGVRVKEVKHWNRKRGLCCGAGGAQMFMEEQGESRVNVKRTLQLLDTGASTIASACPFCMTMLTDGLKAHDREDVAQLDVAELLERSLDLAPQGQQQARGRHEA